MERKILLNPGPATTTGTVKMAQIVPDICPREKEFGSMMQRIREDLVRIVHGDLDTYTAVLFCGSGTICMDVCVNSLLPEGKKILVISNGAYSDRAVEICTYYQLPHIALSFPIDESLALAKIKDALEQNPDIALVYTTHHETGTGVLNPIREIGALAHTYNAVFVVDTTSSYAMIPIDIKRENIDFCMSSAQKGIMAMTGLSYVIGNKKMIEASKNYPKRSYYCNLHLQYDFFERTGEMHFTPPVQTVYAAKQALLEYFAEGEEEKWKRHLRIFDAIQLGLQELGLRNVIKREYQSGLVVSVRYPDDAQWNFESVHDYCYERGFTIYPGKISTVNTFRLCTLGAIDMDDIVDFFKVLKNAFNALNIKIPASYKED